MIVIIILSATSVGDGAGDCNTDGCRFSVYSVLAAFDTNYN